MRAHQLKSLSTVLTREDILAAIGLERRRTATDYIAPAIGIFGVGLIVGSSLALLFAPKAGRNLRGDIGRTAGNIATRARRRSGNGHIDVNQLSKDELDERATALGISNRTEMTREELITAIRNH